MENLGLGAGLAAIAFWGFIAAVVFITVWDGVRKREAQHETIRRMVESGQSIDEKLMAKLSLISNSEKSRPDRDFFVTGLWLVPVSVGLGLFAFILGSQVPQAFIPLIGTSALTMCIGVGALIAAKITGRWYSDVDSPKLNPRLNIDKQLKDGM